MNETTTLMINEAVKYSLVISASISKEQSAGASLASLEELLVNSLLLLWHEEQCLENNARIQAFRAVVNLSLGEEFTEVVFAQANKEYEKMLDSL